MRTVLSWNLAKKDLIHWALDEFKPDVALFQEFWLKHFNPVKNPNYQFGMTTSYRKRGFECGTAVLTADTVEEGRKFIITKLYEFIIPMRKTAHAVKVDGIWYLSVHVFNGWPFKNPKKMRDCIEEYVSSLPHNEAAVVSGDFNTWTEDHRVYADIMMAKYGFVKSFSVPYDKKKTMDHVFTRGCRAKLLTSGFDASDHPYMLFNVW